MKSDEPVQLATPLAKKSRSAEWKLRREFEHPRFISHLDRLNAWKKGEPFYPITVEISAAAKCNQRCSFCYTAYLDYPDLTIPEPMLINLVKELAKIDVRQAFFQGTGEPLLNTATPDAIVAAKEAGIPTVFLVTNGVRLMEPQAKKIVSVMGQSDMVRISVFEGERERYATSHGCPAGQFDVLIENIKRLVKLRKPDSFILSATVYPFPHNAGHVYDTVKFCRELGFDMATVAAPLLLSQNPNQNWPRDLRERHADELQRIPELETDDFIANINQRPFDILEKKFSLEEYGCQGIDFFTHVAADGAIYPCFKHWLKEDFCYGKLAEQSFAEIWNSPRRKSIRAAVIKEGPDPEKCCNCAQGRINQTLWELSNPSRFQNFV